MSLIVWNITDKPFENYKGWDLYMDGSKTYGQRTMDTFRIRAVNDKEEIIFEQTSEKQSHYKVKVKIKNYIDSIENYKDNLNDKDTKILILRKIEYNVYKNFLHKLYKETFSTPPFDSSVSDKYIKDFFDTQVNSGKIVMVFYKDKPAGFISIEPFELFSDNNLIEDIENAFYISAIAISKKFKGQGLGSKIFKFVTQMYECDKLVVRTRTDTPEIKQILINHNFDKIHLYSKEINNKTVDLLIWKCLK